MLLLSIPADAELREMASAVVDGALVGMGSAADVARARAATAEWEHVMFHGWDGEEIPWRDEYFHVVVGEGPDAEVKRVLIRP